MVFDSLWGKSEGKVGVTNGGAFRDEICKLNPAEQAKMLQNMEGADKSKPVTTDAAGHLMFPGQFTIGSVGGTSNGNHFNLGSPTDGKRVVIQDLHNNLTTINCGDGDSTATGTKSAPAEGKSPRGMSNEQLEDVLRRAGIDPKTMRPLKQDGAGDPSSAPEHSIGTRTDITLPDKSHVRIDQVENEQPKIAAPKGVIVTPNRDGGMDIKFGGTTLHEKNGSLSSDGDINGVRVTKSPLSPSDR